MFLSKTAHAAVVAAKDAQIATLRNEVAFLRSMLMPVGRPYVSLEADLAIGGHAAQVEPQESPEAAAKKLAIDTEAARVLAGTY